jgi:hypothetical protein
MVVKPPLHLKQGVAFIVGQFVTRPEPVSGTEEPLQNQRGLIKLSTDETNKHDSILMIEIPF